MAKLSKKPLNLEAREQFFEDIQNGRLSLSAALKKMRALVGMTQHEYAKFVGVAPRIVIDIERNVANPTLKSLQKIAQPFHLSIMFTLKKES